MSRARVIADMNVAVALKAPLADPDFTGTVDLTGTTVQLDDDEISLDKVSGGTLGAGDIADAVTGAGHPSASSDPGGASAGDLYYNTTSNRLRVHDGTDWGYVSPVFSTGGTVTSYISGSTTYRIHTFLTTGTFTAKSALTNVDILVVGGGGAGVGGGGGGGQVRTHTGQTLAVGDHTVSIGDGGVGANGDPSQFGTLASAIGGGRGGGANERGQDGASGGGGGWGCQSATGGGSGTAGHNGSAADHNCNAPHWLGAGGGAGDGGQGYGSGARGGNGLNVTYRDGTTQYYGGGGGGGVYYDYAMSAYGASATGGGGRGWSKESNKGEDGNDNTGGGGGAGSGEGGSGIVVIRIQQKVFTGD